MTNRYVPLHCHSHYSLLDGYQTVPEYARYLTENGYRAGGLTDHGVVSGLEEFDYELRRMGGVKPILGIEAYLTDDVTNIMTNRPILDSAGRPKVDKKTGEPMFEKQRPKDFNHGCMWAENDRGLENLFTLSTLSYERGFYRKPRIDLAMMRDYHDGLFVSDGCLLSQVARAAVDAIGANDDKSRQTAIDKAYDWIESLVDIFGRDHVLIELHTWQFTNPGKDEHSLELNRQMRAANHLKLQLARDLGLMTIAVNDAHYGPREDYEWHELEWSTTTKKGEDYNDDKTDGRGETAAWVMNDDEVRYWLGKHGLPEDAIEESIENTSRIADACNAHINRSLNPPRFLDTREEDEELFDRTIADGFKELVPKKKAGEYMDRLNREVELVKKCDLTGYFNTVADYSNFVRAEDPDGETYGIEGKHASLLGPGRGCFLPGNLVSTFKRGFPHRNLWPDTGYEFDEPLKRIEDIKVGQKVLTHDCTFHEVLEKYEYDVHDEDCVELTLSNGHVIRCTADHCIFRQDDGFVRADELHEGDVLEGSYRPKETVDVVCADCGHRQKLPFIKWKSDMTTSSVVRDRGVFICAHCRNKRNSDYCKPITSKLGAIAAASPESRLKNSESVKRFWETHPDVKDAVAKKTVERYKNPVNRMLTAEATSKGLSMLGEEQYMRMSLSNGYKTGIFYSQKMGRNIFFASSYELKAIHIFETDSNVVSYDRCKSDDGDHLLYIRYGYARRYNPDFDVRYSDGTRKIIEVKADWRRNDPVTLAKADAARAYCDAIGAEYEIWGRHELEVANDWQHIPTTVTSVRHFKYTGKVYDLHVEGVHNYTVGRVTVHNSAGGSLVCYLMHITNLDPIKFGLIFERFLTAGRVISTVHVAFDDGTEKSYDPSDMVELSDGTSEESWHLLDEAGLETKDGVVDHTWFDFHDCPDIDLDFTAEVIPFLNAYLKKRYGEENFCHIGTFQELKLASAIKDIARVDGISPQEAMGYVRELEASGWPMNDSTLSHTFDELWQCIALSADLMDLGRDFWERVWQWCGRYRSEGIHASGYVISKASLMGRVPLRIKKGEDLYTSQWDYDSIVRCGFIKFDILKLSSLDTITDVYRLTHDGELDVQEAYREMRDERLLRGKALWGPTWGGDTLGIFQMDTKLGTTTAMNARINSLRDAGMLSAADRPGLVRSGLIDEFYKVRLGQMPPNRYHPLIDDILEETDGFILYQEQIMSIYQRMCGMTMGEADNVRKIFSKKKLDKVEAMKSLLHDSCLSNSEFVRLIPSKYRDAEECFGDIWRGLSRTAEYSFNKSHAQSYGQITAVEELYKVNFPAEFITASLNTDPSDTRFISWARAHGIRVAPPNVNLSGSRYELRDGVIYMPIYSIKGIGPAAVREIFAGAPYSSFDDYLERTSGRGGRKKDVMTSLISIGAFDGVDPRDRFELMCIWKTMRKEEPPKRNTWKSARVRGRIEERLIGVSLSYDPVLDNREMLESLGPQSLPDVMQTEVGGFVSVAGEITEIRRHQAKTGEMAWVKIRLVSHDDVEVTVFPSRWSDMKDLLQSHDLVSVRCKRTDDYNGKMSLIAMSVRNMSLEDKGVVK